MFLIIYYTYKNNCLQSNIAGAYEKKPIKKSYEEKPFLKNAVKKTISVNAVKKNLFR